MKILAIANQKGGVAKTTTAVNLAAFLGHMGKQVLLIDLDPQANATSGLGIDRDKVEKSIYNVLIGQESLESIIIESPTSGVSVAVSTLGLVGAEVELVNTDRREFRLADAINQNASRNRYDLVIIDTPPSLGLLTLNAMTAADSVLIPMQCEYYALEGLAQLYKTIQLVRKKTNPSLAIEGLLFAMVDMRSNLTVQVMEEVKKFLKDKVYETVIPRNIRLAEAPGFGKPILSYDRSSKGADAYERLAKEFLARSAPAQVSEAPAPAESISQPQEVATP
ncbi:MAG: AAA family ATPase [Elusimicrobiota bacterium]|jgi:chromosome partitioning protein